MKLSVASTTVLGSVLFALLSFNRRVQGQQSSCVQTMDAMFSACPCDAAEFSFSVVGETSVANNTVSRLDTGHNTTGLCVIKRDDFQGSSRWYNSQKSGRNRENKICGWFQFGHGVRYYR